MVGPRHAARGLGVTAAAVLGLTLAAAPSVAQGAAEGDAGAVTAITRPAASPHTVLTCSAKTAKPITFDPPLTQRAQQATFRGTISLINCTSPDNSHPRPRSGQLTFEGGGLATCTGVEKATGSGTITWKDANGVKLGTSTLRPNLNAIDSYNPGNAVLFGEITGGMLKGTRTSGRAIPTSDISKCATTGLTGVEGAGTMDFITVS
ncbi:hypothetical protein ACQP1K_26205 [Sphaerimonospora sp. CA-214678]|uniref:hypothetical protein n=1 Tax=Sphaerimonospora sp. CA-214678 TaxID=3240029 RepID=UPI003D90EB91